MSDANYNHQTFGSFTRPLGVVTGINLKNTGPTTLYTVPNGVADLFVFDVFLRSTNSDTVAVGPTVLVGKV